MEGDYSWVAQFEEEERGHLDCFVLIPPHHPWFGGAYIYKGVVAPGLKYMMWDDTGQKRAGVRLEVKREEATRLGEAVGGVLAEMAVRALESAFH
jgi:hypothetical protein